MGLAQRKYEEPQVKPLGDVLEMNKSAAGDLWRQPWIWIVIAAAILCMVWIAWDFGGIGGSWPGNRAAPVVVPPTSDIAVLDATERGPFAGQTFRVKSIRVQYIVNNHVLWVGESNSAPMLVVFSGAERNSAYTGISDKDRVNVIGTVEAAPPADQARHDWSLSFEDTYLLEHEGAYIQATQVTQSTAQDRQ